MRGPKGVPEGSRSRNTAMHLPSFDGVLRRADTVTISPGMARGTEKAASATKAMSPRMKANVVPWGQGMVPTLDISHVLVSSVLRGTRHRSGSVTSRTNLALSKRWDHSLPEVDEEEEEEEQLLLLLDPPPRPLMLEVETLEMLFVGLGSTMPPPADT